MKLTKKKKLIQDILNQNNMKKSEYHDINDVIKSLKSIPKSNFKNFESIDVSIRLGIDPTKSDQIIRSSSSLPHGNGKKNKSCSFC
jgi:large subunit ribosomal protein L1